MASGSSAAPRVWRGRDALPRVRRCTSARPFQPFILIPPFLCVCYVLWTRDAGRAGAHPYRATRGDPRFIH